MSTAALPSGDVLLTVEANHITQEYDQPDGGVLRVIDDLNMMITGSSINMLLGPSGCGKSTLLRMLGGVRPWNVKTPTTGVVKIGGQECVAPHPDAVMVFQHYNNRPDLTVRENVMYPFTFGEWKKRVSTKEANARVDGMLAEVGLADKAGLFPWQLSGGQNQRVALAQKLVLRPKVLLMDEPFGALDAQTRATMQSLLVGLHKAHPCVVVFVTHDVTEALLVGDRVLVMSTQPAKLIDDFNIDTPHPRRPEWLTRPEVRAWQDRVVGHLRATAGRGSVRVSV